MSEAAVLAAIVVGFAVLLALKHASGLRFCVLCASLAGTWLVLLVLYRAGMYGNTLLLALLMGQSVTGLHYLLEKRVPESLLVFRLPFVLTLTALAYLLLAPGAPGAAALAVVLAAVWAAALAVYARRDVGRFRRLARQIVECCRDW